MVLSAFRTGEGVEEAMPAEAVARLDTGMLLEVAEVASAALEEAEVVVAGGADDDGLLGGWSDAYTPHMAEGGALALNPVSMGRREAVAGGTGTVTTGGTSQPLDPKGGRELWAWSWAMKPGWEIRS